MTDLVTYYLRAFLLAAVLAGVNTDVDFDKNTVEQWAKLFGQRLYEQSLKYSGAKFIREEYGRREDLRVERVEGVAVVREMATKMENMLKYKVEAVKSLRTRVEEAHKDHRYNEETEYEYFNSNLINTNYSREQDPDKLLRKSFPLTPNEHFNNIAVNLNKSTVQVPANVYNFGPDVLNGIEETEVLNEVFQENYERDPTLTWQYFGHNTGFFRNYPGIEWEKNSAGLDLYDCRKRGWYISSATSPKDVIILIDTSGSMTGLRYQVAKHTVNNIMETLGDDDFFNVISFNDSTEFIQPCFNGTLVQANADNKNLIKQGLTQMHGPQNIANFKKALVEAFELLESFNNTGTGASCNQAIMLITDGAHENFEEIFEQYNAEKHVRVFTYLIGADIKDDVNVQWMSCNNKGYHTRIGAFADVEENASKYIHVLSRPMVIEQDHITVWTNVYMDTLGLQLMTTVSQPVFNIKENSIEQGILLGVAGVDVPVKELLKLTPAYKLGVSGYPFAITNNGYILYHPDLRPKDENGDLKPNYNSVDLAEVELSDADEQLRTAMVDRKTGNMSMTVRVHSRDMKRLHFRHHYYYYTPLAETPFSLGIVLSGEAGHNQLMGFETFTITNGNATASVCSSGDLCLLKQGLENLFGDNETESTILANWIFCHLNNTEAMTMTRPEALEKYLQVAMENGGTLSEKCDRELINHVIFDANATMPIVSYWEGVYDTPTAPPKQLSNETLARRALYEMLCDNQRMMCSEATTSSPISLSTPETPMPTTPDEGLAMTGIPLTSNLNTTGDMDNATDIPMSTSFPSTTIPGVTQLDQDFVGTSQVPNLTSADVEFRSGVVLSFIGTKGGMTRIFKNPHATKTSKFAQEYGNTIEEEYYQRAVEIPTDKFVYSIPLQGLSEGFTSDGSEPLVTASTTVLVNRDGKRSIAAAVGLQILSTSLRDLFMQTTLVLMEDCNNVAFHCELTCYNESVGCYLLDEHGYVIMSKDSKEIGMHLVSLTDHARVLDRLLDKGVYSEFKQIDYQAMCEEAVTHVSAASRFLDPLISISTFVVGFLQQLFLLFSHLGIFYSSWEASYVEGRPTTTYIKAPCDKEMSYFTSNNDMLPVTGYIQSNCDDCIKSFSAHAIPHSNLMMLIADLDCTCDVVNPISLTPKKVVYNSSQWCQRLRTQVHRRRPEPCHSQHDLENSTDCGKASWLQPSLPWILLLLLAKSVLTHAMLRS